MDNRNKEMDIMKALGIIAVVLGHTDFRYGNILYMYHMALFFFVSGYFVNDKIVQNPKEWLIKKVRNYYLPYLTFSFIFILLRNLLVNIKIYEEHMNMKNRDIFQRIKEIILFASGEPLLGTFWFFQSILYVSILFLIINLVLKKFNARNEENLVFTVGILYIISFVFWKKGLNIIGILNPNNKTLMRMFLLLFDVKVLMLLSIYLTGYLYKNHKSKININFKYFILSILILFYFKDQSIIEISQSKFEGPIMFYFLAMVGIYANLYIAKVLNKRKQKLLAYIGANSMYIMVFHFLVFKIVSFMQIAIYKLPIERLSEFPVIQYKSYNKWLVVYVIVGILAPLLIKMSINFLQKVFIKYLPKLKKF